MRALSTTALFDAEDSDIIISVMGRKGLIATGAVLLALLGGFFLSASAERFTGGSYQIDASIIGNSFGGDTTGGSYQLTSSGGESVIGQGSGGSYKLDSGYVAQLQQSIQLAVQPGNLRAYYPMDELDGSFVRDASASNLNGSTVNAPTWVASNVGRAVNLNGTSQSVAIAHNANMNLTTDFTVSAWIKPGIATQGGFARIISKFDGTNLNYMLSYDSAGTNMRFLVDCSSRATLVGTSALTDTNSWYHVLGVKSGTTVKLYVNGQEEASGTCSGSVLTNTSPLNIGADAGSSYFAGAIDEVKLLARALSSPEIEAEYDAGVAGNTAGLSFADNIIAGISQTSPFDAIVLTDAKAYSLAINQNQNLTSGSNTIPGITGTITSPITWSEGTTKGLGFTLFDTNASPLDSKWSSGNAYASLPMTSTTIYNRVGTGSKDVLNMRLRLDVDTAQASGLYTNIMTTTGTITP